MKITNVITVFCVFAISLFSCTESPRDKVEVKENESKKEIVKLDYDLKNLLMTSDFHKKYIEELREENENLSSRLSELEVKLDSQNIACFNISEGMGDFQVVSADAGKFYISLKSVTPYLSGYKLVFSIGNPSFATFDNVKIKIKWNRSLRSYLNDDDFNAKLNIYKKEFADCLEKINENPNFPKRPTRTCWTDEFKEKEFSTLKKLNPGKWNDIEVHVTPAQLEELEHIEVTVETPVAILS
jgi:hypothetical protein